MTPLARAAAVTFGAAAAAGIGAFVYGVAVERNRFTVRHETLPILEAGARSITILQLSDLHLAPWQDGRIEFIRSLIRTEPDLVVDTGDNWGHVDALPAIRDALEPYAGIPGVFVNGSNDVYGPVFKSPLRYFTGPSRLPRKPPKLATDQMERFFTDELGWLDLNNAAHAVELRGSRIELFGTNDAHRDWDRLDLLPGEIERMRENVGWSPQTRHEILSIGVTHAPYRRVLDHFVDEGAELILAGHTHGGQVRIPGMAPLVTNSDIPREQAQGLSVWRNIRHSGFLNVSAGIGTSIYAPFRFACPPEAVVLTLVGRE